MERDQRRGVRYRLRLPCRVSSPFSTFQELSGVTGNLSRSGMLVLFENLGSARALNVGQLARIVVELPSRKNFPRKSLGCVGRVVRVEAGVEGCDVAFEVSRMKFLDGRPAGSFAQAS